MRLLLLMAIASLGPTPSTDAQPAPASPRIVHMYGDSIFGGYGFAAERPAGTASTEEHPSFLNRIDLIDAELASANGSAVEFRATDQEAMLVCGDIRFGEVQPEDAVVVENAGLHFGRAGPYRQWLELFVYCARHKNGKRLTHPPELVLTTMFDYGAAPHSQYDRPLKGGQSLNDVTRAVARKHDAALLDWNCLMDKARRNLNPEKVNVVHPDGIHPNVWGNIVLAGSLARHAHVPMEELDPILDELVEWQDPMYDLEMGPYFTHETARGWVRELTANTC